MLRHILLTQDGTAQASVFHYDTRGIIDAILNGAIKTVPTKTIPYFNFEVPTELPGVDSGILDPRDTYANASDWGDKG